MIGLDQSCTVYTPNGTTGTYTVVAKSGLACRLGLRTAMDAAPEREEMSGRRLLVWDGSYTMPAKAQILLGGERWNIVEGSVAYPRSLFGGIDHGRAEVIREE